MVKPSLLWLTHGRGCDFVYEVLKVVAEASAPWG